MCKAALGFSSDGEGVASPRASCFVCEEMCERLMDAGRVLGNVPARWKPRSPTLLGVTVGNLALTLDWLGVPAPLGMHSLVVPFAQPFDTTRYLSGFASASLALHTYPAGPGPSTSTSDERRHVQPRLPAVTRRLDPTVSRRALTQLLGADRSRPLGELR